MSQTIVRQVRGEEMLEALFGLDAYAFRASPPLADRAGWEEVMTERHGATFLALFEGQVAVSVAAVSPLTQ
jgi:hypothetical protein